jgi:hypothetical protein
VFYSGVRHPLDALFLLRKSPSIPTLCRAPAAQADFADPTRRAGAACAAHYPTGSLIWRGIFGNGAEKDSGAPRLSRLTFAP